MEKEKKQLFILKESLEDRIGKKLHLKINDNRSTMLSVKWEADCTRVSLHRMFLKAPLKVMQDLTGYLKQEKKNLTPDVKAYIEKSLQTFDYSHRCGLHFSFSICFFSFCFFSFLLLFFLLLVIL